MRGSFQMRRPDHQHVLALDRCWIEPDVGRVEDSTACGRELLGTLVLGDLAAGEGAGGDDEVVEILRGIRGGRGDAPSVVGCGCGVGDLGAEADEAAKVVFVDVGVEVVLDLLCGRPGGVVAGHVHVREAVRLLGVLRGEARVATRLGPHAADVGARLEDGDVVIVLGEVLGGGDAGKACADDCHAHGEDRRQVVQKVGGQGSEPKMGWDGEGRAVQERPPAAIYMQCNPRKEGLDARGWDSWTRRGAERTLGSGSESCVIGRRPNAPRCRASSVERRAELPGQKGLSATIRVRRLMGLHSLCVHLHGSQPIFLIFLHFENWKRLKKCGGRGARSQSGSVPLAPPTRANRLAGCLVR
ncbi:hypothetical protein L1887_58612 [Cichorium endivia]|nr:hypothetical protein L1887_58612 [Cichorium endivia]